ncbi:hypothetical protein Ga0466249_000028 [Sporomusaceae bacterium BoRhaA]|uniref:hypothetical protein n=1 Tax=Pelorhabdus rhamnosifermentans TaxID=2772457 RepID=UPI001C05F542|nr:hypothetical protein [Pelorhabdus rhamnosifermentans]MBU2698949.1 hypothetical protein [Pelorhabdus rhamnosifermentans]
MRNRLFSILLVLMMVVAMTTTVFASSASKTFTSRDTMSLYLAPGATGNSNAITFNVYGLPTGAIVTKARVDADTIIQHSGMGAILSINASLKSNVTNDYVTLPWGPGNITNFTTGITGGNGAWSFYYRGTNVSSSYDSAKWYQGVTLTIYYNY